MPVNPGERYPKPTAPQQAAQAVRGSIAYFEPLLSALLVALAVALVFVDQALPAVLVALVAGRVAR